MGDAVAGAMDWRMLLSLFGLGVAVRFKPWRWLLPFVRGVRRG